MYFFNIILLILAYDFYLFLYLWSILIAAHVNHMRAKANVELFYKSIGYSEYTNIVFFTCCIILFLCKPFDDIYNSHNKVEKGIIMFLTGPSMVPCVH